MNLITESAEKIYLEYLNSFLTIERFAEYYSISIENTEKLIRVCKDIREDRIAGNILY
jgi:hypothetical protein